MARRRLSVSDIAILTEIPASTLYRWVADERLTVERRKGVAYLALGEVQELADLRERCGSMPRHVDPD